MLVSEQERVEFEQGEVQDDDDAQETALRVEGTVTFHAFNVNKNGGFVYQFEFPVSEMSSAMQTVLFVGQNRLIEATAMVLDDDHKRRESLKIGLLKFERLIFKRGGESVLTLLGERLEELYMKQHELRQFLDQSMVLILKEFTPSET